ncbi:hypothetical protein WICPIJ_001822 [Wickerhamomyces pijperi]|uniref:Uncharacterized protein n=1 Tax=Wickerhamomyces pijperi TaxID=599730 RepID=A0A9P8QCS8_WICPI|nr:hypothetical protein WICPIJ_001822 [Wickerhamomyces pijperi]
MNIMIRSDTGSVVQVEEVTTFSATRIFLLTFHFQFDSLMDGLNEFQVTLSLVHGSVLHEQVLDVGVVLDVLSDELDVDSLCQVQVIGEEFDDVLNLLRDMSVQRSEGWCDFFDGLNIEQILFLNHHELSLVVEHTFVLVQVVQWEGNGVQLVEQLLQRQRVQQVVLEDLDVLGANGLEDFGLLEGQDASEQEVQAVRNDQLVRRAGGDVEPVLLVDVHQLLRGRCLDLLWRLLGDESEAVSDDDVQHDVLVRKGKHIADLLGGADHQVDHTDLSCPLHVGVEHRGLEVHVFLLVQHLVPAGDSGLQLTLVTPDSEQRGHKVVSELGVVSLLDEVGVVLQDTVGLQHRVGRVVQVHRLRVEHKEINGDVALDKVQRQVAVVLVGSLENLAPNSVLVENQLTWLGVWNLGQSGDDLPTANVFQKHPGNPEGRPVT